MTSDEFAKNFYLEKLAFLKSCFQAQPEQPSAVNVKIKEMALTAHQTEKLKEVIDILLDDVFKVSQPPLKVFTKKLLSQFSSAVSLS